MLRSIGKTCFAHAYKLTHPSRRSAQPKGTMPFIVCYHRVVENFERSAAVTIPSMLISTRMLEQHLDWLAKRFSLLPLDEIGEQLEAGEPFRKPAAAITFDDGYSDDYHQAFPLLKRKGIPAAFFVVTGLIDSGRPQVFDRLYLLLRLLQRQRAPLASTLAGTLEAAGAENTARLRAVPDEPFAVMTAALQWFPRRCVETAISTFEADLASHQDILKEMTPLSWDMLERMHRGGMTIGSHTHSHLLLTAETIETAQNELIESKRILERRLNTTIRHFAYPDGRFNPAVVDAVRSADYRFAYNICASRDEKSPLLTIPRKVLWEHACLNPFGKFSSAVMNCQVNWAFDIKRHCGHDHSQACEELTKTHPSVEFGFTRCVR